MENYCPLTRIGTNGKSKHVTVKTAPPQMTLPTVIRRTEPLDHSPFNTGDKSLLESCARLSGFIIRSSVLDLMVQKHSIICFRLRSGSSQIRVFPLVPSSGFYTFPCEACSDAPSS